MKTRLAILLLAPAFGALVWAGPSPKTGSVTVTWQYDWANPTNQGVSNFVVYWSTTSSNYSTGSLTGTNQVATVTNLNRGTTYYFVVTALTTNGVESDYSPEVSIKIPNKPTAPTSTTAQ